MGIPVFASAKMLRSLPLLYWVVGRPRKRTKNYVACNINKNKSTGTLCLAERLRRQQQQACNKLLQFIFLV